LHFGGYDQANAPIAHLLNPLPAAQLTSTTQLGKLSDGRNLKFEDLSNFDGHVKIHLANEGPEYAVILVAGNIGAKARAEFDPHRIAVCGKSF
jgi:hypothetical protein